MREGYFWEDICKKSVFFGSIGQRIYTIALGSARLRTRRSDSKVVIQYSSMSQAEIPLNLYIADLKTDPATVQQFVDAYRGRMKTDQVLKRLILSPEQVTQRVRHDAKAAARFGWLEQPAYNPDDSILTKERTLADVFAGARQLAVDIPDITFALNEQLDLCSLASMVRARDLLFHLADPMNGKDFYTYRGAQACVDRAAHIAQLRFIANMPEEIITQYFMPQSEPYNEGYVNEMTDFIRNSELDEAGIAYTVFRSLMESAKDGRVDSFSYDTLAVKMAIANNLGVPFPDGLRLDMLTLGLVSDSINGVFHKFYEDQFWDLKDTGGSVEISRESPPGRVYTMLEKAQKFLAAKIETSILSEENSTGSSQFLCT